jgi:hypothetical protein
LPSSLRVEDKGWSLINIILRNFVQLAQLNFYSCHSPISNSVNAQVCSNGNQTIVLNIMLHTITCTNPQKKIHEMSCVLKKKHSMSFDAEK